MVDSVGQSMMLEETLEARRLFVLENMIPNGSLFELMNVQDSCCSVI